MRPRVLLADDQLMVAEGVGRIIGDIVDLVGVVSDGATLIAEVRRVKPDIVVTDVNMPLIGGIEAMRQLRAERSPARFIFITSETDSRVAAEAMQAGASAYLLKQSAARELLDAICSVIAGRSYLTPLIKPATPRKLKPADSPSRQLTPRQRDVLRLLAQGKKMREIAQDLNISIRTVEGHKQQMMRSLGIESNADLVRFAIKQRVISG